IQPWFPPSWRALALGPDVKQGGKTVHTLWLANDNDFLTQVPDKNNGPQPKPVFRFRFHRHRPGRLETRPATVQIFSLVGFLKSLSSVPRPSFPLGREF